MENKVENTLSPGSVAVLKSKGLKIPTPTEKNITAQWVIALQRGTGSWHPQADTLPQGQTINTDLLQCKLDVAGGAGEAIHTPGLVKS